MSVILTPCTIEASLSSVLWMEYAVVFKYSQFSSDKGPHRKQNHQTDNKRKKWAPPYPPAICGLKLTSAPTWKEKGGR